MRKLGMALLAGTLVAVPYAAFSQDSGPSTADEFACALAGDCGDEADVETEDGDPTAQPAGQPRVSATRGFSLSTTRPATSRPKAQAPATRPNRRQTASRPAQRPTRPATQQQGRVDLRLSFRPGSAELSAADLAQVQAFAEALKRPQLATVRVRIEGHTDSSGGRAINEALSQRRAQAVADFLAGQGIDPTRLEVRGFAYDRPLPGLPASASANRRVEAVRIS
ncbi:OmpA family protein [Sphingosinicella sp. CPCC 101087]|uniref:OmpA family protein n=1 Tax=Sphingosinicella sp. CPCC 101087 TaxID=2497754 RepID=UPI0019819B05|nr:OmpA family protein [Sphingosinicella sp. CPCC 101087]